VSGKEGIRPAPMIPTILPPFTPCSSAVNMRSVQTDGSTHAQRARMSPACVARVGTAAGLCSVVPSFTHPPSCAPFAPCPLRHFIATTGALTPGQLSAAVQVSLLHARDLPTVPSPTTATSCRALSRYLQHDRPPSRTCLPVFGGIPGRLGLHLTRG